MKHFRRSVYSTLVSAALLLITLPATANAAIPGGPRPVPLRLLPGDTAADTVASAVNDQGVIVGWAWGTNGGAHAIRWSPAGRPTELNGLPGSGYSVAEAINNRGDIVGYSTTAGVDHAVRWNARGVITDLGTLPPRNEGTDAYGINDRGVVVGYAPIRSKVVHAVEWPANGAITDLGTNSPLGSTQAQAINNRGFVAGTTFEIGPSHLNQPVEWTPSGTITALPTPPEWAYGDANAINDSGIVVGDVQVGQLSNGRDVQAAVWIPHGSTTDLTVLPDGGSAANGVDDRGLIVGGASASDGNAIPVFWYRSAGTWRMAQLPLPPGDTGGDATAINNRGSEAIGAVTTAAGQAVPVYWRW